ncbi:MAG TPA: hypothetical protein PK069_05150, partial [Methanolinea sp.]|nr:hypothetical protein [Methanolinea sp.]
GHGFTIPFIPDQQTCRFLMVSYSECRKALLRGDAGVVREGGTPSGHGFTIPFIPDQQTCRFLVVSNPECRKALLRGDAGVVRRGIISPGLDPAPFFPSFPLKNTPDTSFLSSLLELSSPPCSPIFN